MEKVKITDFCNISNGFAFKSEEYVNDNGARVIRITNVQKGKIVDNDPKLYPFSEIYLSLLNAKPLEILQKSIIFTFSIILRLLWFYRLVLGG